MHASYVIKRPLITEKSTADMNDLKRFAFEVDPRADKVQIKHAVQSLYNVRVLDVSTQVRKGRQRRLRYGMITTATTKKAIVRLHPEDNIEFF